MIAALVVLVGASEELVSCFGSPEKFFPSKQFRRSPLVTCECCPMHFFRRMLTSSRSIIHRLLPALLAPVCLALDFPMFGASAASILVCSYQHHADWAAPLQIETESSYCCPRCESSGLNSSHLARNEHSSRNRAFHALGSTTSYQTSLTLESKTLACPTLAFEGHGPISQNSSTTSRSRGDSRIS